MVVAFTPPTVIVTISVPSVISSLRRLISMIAMPFEFKVTEFINKPFSKSFELTPDKM